MVSKDNIRSISLGKVYCPLIFLILIAAIIRSHGITTPLGKAWEVDLIPMHAVNLLKYGWEVTRGVPILSVTNGQPLFYANHPPLTTWFTAVAFHIFGVSEVSLRIPFILLSLGEMVLAVLIVNLCLGPQFATWAGFLLAILPVESYFGRVALYTPVTNFFCLAYSYLILLFLKNRKKIYGILLSIIVILGSLTDWPFQVVLIFWLIYSFVRKRRRKEILVLTSVGLLVSLLYLQWVNVISVQPLVARVIATQGWFQPELLADIRFWTKVLHDITFIYTAPCLIMALGGFVVLFSTKRDRESFIKDASPFYAMASVGIVHLILASRGFRVHEFFWSEVSLPIIFLAAVGFMKSHKLIRWSAILLTVVFSLLSLRSYHQRDVGVYECAQYIKNNLKPSEKAIAICPEGPYAAAQLAFSAGCGSLLPNYGPNAESIIQGIRERFPRYVVVKTNSSNPDIPSPDVIQIASHLTESGYQKLRQFGRWQVWGQYTNVSGV